jgi:hypothetical protein
VSLLEKDGCEHVKAMIGPEFVVLANDIKEPSAKAIALGERLYYEIWLTGTKQMADKAFIESEGEVLFWRLESYPSIFM